MPRNTVGLPDTFITRLDYYQLENAITMDASGFYAYKNIWRANSVYDPDDALGGGQPAYFDQLAALYTNYRVTAVKYKFTIVNKNGTNPMFATSLMTRQTTTQNDVQALASNSNSTGMCVISSEGSDNMATIEAYTGIDAIMGVPMATILADNQYSASVGTNPEKLGLLYFIANTSGSNTTTFDLQVQISYYVRFEDLKPVVDV